MAKQLGEVCENILIKTAQVSRKQDEEGGEWQTYVVLMGESVNASGERIVGEDIHDKILVGSPGPDPWDEATIDNDLKAAGNAVKARYKEIAKDKADINL